MTIDLNAAKAICKISTHTLTWSVTEDLIKDKFVHFNFNSHAHVERDAKMIQCELQAKISTHTLTWSVTL